MLESLSLTDRLPDPAGQPHDPQLAGKFYGVLAEAGVHTEGLLPLVPGETPVGQPNIIQGTYDPRGEGESPGSTF